MRYSSNQNFIRFQNEKKSVREALNETPPCQFANLGPCLGHELHSVNGHLHFLKETKAQTRQLVIIVPDSLIQLNAGRGKKSNLQR
jgi:hypothetical protein